MGMDENLGIAADKNAWLKKMASAGVLFYILPWLMVLLVAGTVAQKEMGIYAAQKIFFSSWILWFGPIPLPGAYTTIGVLTLCLAAKFILYSPWRKERMGTIITHLGILILLVGGIITAFSQSEGFLSLREGQSGKTISDYHDRMLWIEKNGEQIAAIPFSDLAAGERILTADLPFSVSTIATCDNCRPSPVQNITHRKGLAEQMALSPAPPEKENETNLAGVTLQLTGLPDDQDGVYIVMEEIPHKANVNMDGAQYAFSMGRAETILPFSIELVDFKRVLHPGTNMASGFSSDVIVHDGDVAWPYTISMNEPLRYKGYTFYQASFSEKPDGEYSVLSVVRNQGRAFPYIASALIFAGLLLHIIVRLRLRRAVQS